MNIYEASPISIHDAERNGLFDCLLVNVLGKDLVMEKVLPLKKVQLLEKILLWIKYYLD